MKWHEKHSAIHSALAVTKLHVLVLLVRFCRRSTVPFVLEEPHDHPVPLEFNIEAMVVLRPENRIHSLHPRLTFYFIHTCSCLRPCTHMIYLLLRERAPPGDLIWHRHGQVQVRQVTTFECLIGRHESEIQRHIIGCTQTHTGRSALVFIDDFLFFSWVFVFIFIYLYFFFKMAINTARILELDIRHARCRRSARRTSRKPRLSTLRSKKCLVRCGG